MAAATENFEAIKAPFPWFGGKAGGGRRGRGAGLRRDVADFILAALSSQNGAGQPRP